MSDLENSFIENGLIWSHLLSRYGPASDLFGYLASALVLATFSMKCMRRLRWTAIASNIAFITYAVLADIRPILILHSLLLPVNIMRLVQMELSPKAHRAAAEAKKQPVSSSFCKSQAITRNRKISLSDGPLCIAMVLAAIAATVSSPSQPVSPGNLRSAKQRSMSSSIQMDVNDRLWCRGIVPVDIIREPLSHPIGGWSEKCPDLMVMGLGVVR